jgi:hypothetical protein
MSVLNRRSLEQPADTNEVAATAPPPVPATPQAAPAPTAQDAVVLTAVAPAWIQVTDQGNSLFQGELQPGQSYTVPATAVAPMLKVGKPEALKINVGSAVAPQVGPSGKVKSKISLKGPDLMRGPQQATAAPAASPPAATSPKPAPRRAPRAAAPPPPPATVPAPPPATNTATQ